MSGALQFAYARALAAAILALWALLELTNDERTES